MYRKEVYHPLNGRFQKVVIRPYKEDDFLALTEIQSESFPPPFSSELWWDEKQLKNHVTYFPEGALCIEVDGVIVGSVTSVLLSDTEASHASWSEATADGFITNHNPNGDTLYVVDLCIRPRYRNQKLAFHLMNGLYELVIKKNLKRLLGGSRMPRYHTVAHEVTAEQYVDGVIAGTYYDPVMTFLLKAGRIPVTVISHYLEDEESCHYGCLMEWRNPFFNSPQ